MSIENDIPRHTPKRIAAMLGISRSYAQRLCRREVGPRTVYNLNDRQLANVVRDYEERKRNAEKRTSYA